MRGTIHRFLIFFIAGALSLYALDQDLPVIPHTPPELSEVMHLGPDVNSPYTEYTPFITPDEKLLFFESDRPGGVGMTGNFDLWFSTNRKQESQAPDFSLPVNLGRPVNSELFDGLPSLRKLPDGSYELYFTSYASESRPGPQESNIYYSRKQGDSWTTPQPLPGINSDFHDRMPSISPDGKFLYFSSNRPGGYGKDDIWRSEYNADKGLWGEPENLGDTVNTAASEISPSIHVDGITLYFSSNRSGGVGNYDIYVTQLLSQGRWKNPQNLGTPYNSRQDDEYPTVLKSGEYMYFASNRPGGAGGFDIYRARIPLFAKPIVMVRFEGRVKEIDSPKGIEANIEVRGPYGRYNISTGLPEGEFSLEFMNNNIYEIYVSAPGYQGQKYMLDLRSTHEAVTITKEFALRKSGDEGDYFTLMLQYFDTRGKPVAGRATYILSPAMGTSLSSEGEAVDNNRIRIDIPKNRGEWVRLVRNSTLTLQVVAEGYHDTIIEIPLVEIIDNVKTPDERSAVIPVEMRALNQNGDTIAGNGELAATIYFETNVSNRTTEKETEKLKELAERLRDGELRIEIHGHTDRRGSRETNESLSLERALYVKKLLEELGIEVREVTTRGFHYSRPAVEEKTDKDRAKNRRVEIYLFP